MKNTVPTASQPDPAAHQHHTMAELADLLFASPLQPSDNATGEMVRVAVQAQLEDCGHDCTICLLLVAGEYGEHPAAAVQRMSWAVAAVERAFAGVPDVVELWRPEPGRAWSQAGGA